MILPLHLALQLLLQTTATEATSPTSVLTSFFPTSSRVTFVKVPAGRASAAGTAPTALPVYIGVSMIDGVERIDGYAVLDDELGQHEQIGFATRITVAGAIDRIEVTAYREAYGHEIKSQRYLEQWRGKRLVDMKIGNDVDAISGATISSRSTARFLRRALQAVSLAQQQPLPAKR